MNIFGKKYKITKEKERSLEKELSELETKGRKNIADKLDYLRSELLDNDDETIDSTLADKNYLEQRISEIKYILDNCEIVDDRNKSKRVDIGSKVKVGFEGYEEEYMIVSSLEADPQKNKISDESPVGKALVGANVGDTVTVKLGPISRKFRVIKIS